ncbi:FkbM family methyltransferase [Thiobacter aerophilum]|uniref:FkbM family methyltransferase n=1 Tax=Thiobacter aerophilum TaxID=3121275 RepID=A0ABV0EDR2_9BURK
MKLTEKTAILAAAAWLRHSPVTRGRWRIIAATLPLLRRQGDRLGTRLVKTRHGFRFHADLGDWLGQYVYLTGDYEPATARVIASLLRPGDHFADVGANAGFFTLLAAQAVGLEGRVFSFEPLPALRDRLEADLKLNGYRNVTLYDFALSDREDTVTFHEGPAGHKGVSSLRAIADAAARFEVKTRPMDALIEEVTPLRLVKIDVEGAEHRVVRGMARIIETDRLYLLMEITDGFLRALGSNAVELACDVVARGYYMYAITEKGLRPMKPKQAAQENQYNALFAPETIEPGWIGLDAVRYRARRAKRSFSA